MYFCCHDSGFPFDIFVLARGSRLCWDTCHLYRFYVLAESHSWRNEVRVIDVVMGKKSYVMVNSEGAIGWNWLGVIHLFVSLDAEGDTNLSLEVHETKEFPR